ncbi:MAG: DEAD/DEAH box helicase [Pseudonocardiales bacterium]|nr:DEAD/DEAH box helicase [Pseudonocardiales bacterium]
MANPPAEAYPAAHRRLALPHLTEFASGLPFQLDSFQRAACEALEEGHGVLVCAPTGAGKTVIGEFAVHLALAHRRKCFYTTPIKALSNQKYTDLVAQHGAESVGLLTGDTSINGGAPVVVMTTEVLRNMLYSGSSTLDGLAYVVLDEVHYLADRFRGAVWEEVILNLPDSVRLVSLSATVSNAEEFGEWLLDVRGNTAVVLDEHRPVPLGHHMMVGPRMYDLFARNSAAGGAGRLTVEPHLLRRVQELERRSGWDRPHRGGPRFRRPSRVDVVARLDRDALLPAIIFIFSRAGCESAVAQCMRSGLRLTTPEESELTRQVVDTRTAELPEDDLGVLGFWEWRQALERGIAAHHAGMLPAFKETVEELFVRGLVKAVFATETLALGINMPARTVVLERLVKFNGEAHLDLTPGEYTQLTGRAGRRGIDVEGHAVVLWQPGVVDPAQVAGLASTRTYPLRSSFRPGYNMAVNLVDRVGVAAGRALLARSFAQFQADRSVVGLTRRIERNVESLAGYAEAMACHLGDFAEYARLRRRISERERMLARRGDAADQARDETGLAVPLRARRYRQAAGDAELAALRRALRAHPCHRCDERETHARWAERYDRLEQETNTLRQQVAATTHSLARTFDRIRALLAERGYLLGEQLTEHGHRLARLWSETDLLTAECLRHGIWDHLAPAELAAVISALVYEARRDATTPGVPTGPVSDALVATVRLWAELEADERRHHLEQTREPEVGFVWPVYRWARGESLSAVLLAAENNGAELSAGDFVRWCRQVLDALDQVRSVAGEDSPIGATAAEAVHAVRRGVVALGTL